VVRCRAVVIERSRTARHAAIALGMVWWLVVEQPGCYKSKRISIINRRQLLKRIAIRTRIAIMIETQMLIDAILNRAAVASSSRFESVLRNYQ
jgi:hypothetical protein